MGSRPAARAGGEGLVMHMVYQQKDVDVVGADLRLRLARGAALDTTGAAASHVYVFCNCVFFEYCKTL